MLFPGLRVASAHVALTPSEAPAGSSTVVTVSLSHGCDGSSTTQISIPVLDEVETIAPGMNYGWKVETVADEEGETAWIQIPADGQDPDEFDDPTPSLTVTAPVEGGH